MKKYKIIFTACQIIKAKNEADAREVFLQGETLPEGIDIEDLDIQIYEKGG